MDKKVLLKVEFLKEYDVVVCGAGVAGFCCAIQAARQGVRCALIEQSGIAGGIMTSGGNPEIGLFYANGKKVINGIGWEFVSILEKRNAATIPNFHIGLSHPELNISVNAIEAAKLIDEMCLEAGVDIFYGHTLISAETENQDVKNVITVSKQGITEFTANVFVDCTGDGDLGACCGAKFELVKCPQPGTLGFYIDGYDEDVIDYNAATQAYKIAVENGEITKDDFWSMGDIRHIFKHRGSNVNHIFYDTDNYGTITKGEIDGRISICRIIDWFRKNVPGAENIKVAFVSDFVAKREWRRLVCDKQITGNEYKNAVQFDDALCYSFYPIDLHTDGETPLQCIQLDTESVPTVPYSAMIVSELNNLLVAGRCISSDRIANSALRVKASCMAMGQAVGCAGAISIKSGQTLRELDVDIIKQTLIEYNCIVPRISF